MSDAEDWRACPCQSAGETLVCEVCGSTRVTGWVSVDGSHTHSCYSCGEDLPMAGT